jgi:hypothetical protein
MEASHFKSKEKVLTWFGELPENVLIFFGNLNWTLFHQPLSEDTEKIDQMRLNIQQQFDVDLAHNLKLKDAEIGSLKNEKEGLQKTIEDNAGEIKRLNEKVENNEQETKQTVADAIATVKANAKIELENKLGSKQNIIQAKEQEVTTLKAQLGEEKAKAASKNEEIKGLKDDIGSQISNFGQTLNRHFGDNGSSAEKGKHGEDWVYRMLINDPTMKVENVAKGTGHKGDLVVAFSGSNIRTMIDVKKYKAGVKIPLTERTKFFNDLDSTAGYHCGILLSLHGGFNQDMEEFRVYKTEKERKPYCYLGNLATRKNPETVLKILLYVLQQYAASDSASGVSQKKIRKMIEANIEAWMTQQQKLSKSVDDTRKVLGGLEAAEVHCLESFESLKKQWAQISAEDDKGEPPNKVQKMQ